MNNSAKGTYTRFYPDPTLIKGIPIILGAGILLMIVGGLLVTGPSTRQLVFLVASGVPLFLVWFGLSRGTYVEISGKDLRVSRMFFRGKITPLTDVTLICQRPIYAGIFTEVYMKVKIGEKIREQGLINKPGLSDKEYKKLLDMVHSLNPNIEIDRELLRK